jgi:hypothetical protein
VRAETQDVERVLAAFRQRQREHHAGPVRQISHGEVPWP